MSPTAPPSEHVLAMIEPISWDGIATIIAALLATVVAVAGYSIQQRIARKQRRAEIYSEALRAVEDYLEAPYLVHRRDGSAAARQSITTHISDIQSRLSYYCALLDIHAHAEISTAYKALVSATRAEAGKAMREAWEDRPTRRDRGVSISSRLDRSRSDEAKRSYITAVKKNDA
ncbi:hypothetical protein [Nesterenkonia haasae]|uniref:hypothetical protein n=1 Tax=Nesterenkonia haasae TaxID=2587813 RepID=UPI001391433D|nr:hypothetical protein [Nesterenkonia haasae]NDK30621.1 hypothetical protein [Nesterenkonia haasae]